MASQHPCRVFSENGGKQPFVEETMPIKHHYRIRAGHLICEKLLSLEIVEVLLLVLDDFTTLVSSCNALSTYKARAALAHWRFGLVARKTLSSGICGEEDEGEVSPKIGEQAHNQQQQPPAVVMR